MLFSVTAGGCFPLGGVHSVCHCLRCSHLLCSPGQGLSYLVGSSGNSQQVCVQGQWEALEDFCTFGKQIYEG